jgi:hypothetical protein
MIRSLESKEIFRNTMSLKVAACMKNQRFEAPYHNNTSFIKVSVISAARAGETGRTFGATGGEGNVLRIGSESSSARAET